MKKDYVAPACIEAEDQENTAEISQASGAIAVVVVAIVVNTIATPPLG